MSLVFIALWFVSVTNAVITFINPNDLQLTSTYTSTTTIGSDCSKGLTLTLSISDVINMLNNVRVESSLRAAKLVCFQYQGSYYGSGCASSCSAGKTVTVPPLPSYTSPGSTVTIFIPYLEMSDTNIASVTTPFTITIGLDASKSGCSVNNSLADSACDDTKSITINIDNTPPTGFLGSFVMERGDGLIFIDSFDLSGITDSGSGVNSVRFYYSFCGTVPDKATSGYKEFLTKTSDWTIDGLTNGLSYTLRATVLDKAGNEYAMADFLEAADGSIALPVNKEDPTSNCVTPTPVVGFLTQKEGCFVATEVFGQYSNEVSLFRAFRDKTLKKHPSGVLFIKLYYRASPFLIKTVRKYPFLRTIVSAYLETVYGALNFLGVNK